MEKWQIGLPPWILEDGNYKDFHRGQIAEFALEFYPRDGQTIQRTDATTKAAQLNEDGGYQVVAQVTLHSPHVSVIDCGIRAFREPKPAYFSPEIEQGDFVAADLYLGIDPFFYFENLYKLPDMPPLIYTWQIDSIIRQTSPLVERSGRDWLEADTSRQVNEEVEQTGLRSSATQEEQFQFARTYSVHYVLNCTRLPTQPKSQRDS